MSLGSGMQIKDTHKFSTHKAKVFLKIGTFARRFDWLKLKQIF